MKIVWTASAAGNLNEIYDYYAKVNEIIAINVYNRILKETERLINFPNLAPVETSLLGRRTQILRSLVVVSGRFKVIYYVSNNYIQVTHVWACRKNPAEIRLS